jgi:predicted dehydrogenase
MKKFKIIVAGCGAMANTWIDYAKQRTDAEIVGLVDLYEEQAVGMAAKHGLQVPCFTDVKEAALHTGANLVFNITIPSAHKSIALAAFEAGCDVMGEKPLAASPQEAIEMVEAAKMSGRFYAVMQNRRYNRQIRSLRKIIEEGHIGEVGFINADFFLGPHFGGFREAMESPLLLDMAIHTFDQARFICGVDPVSVYCHEFNPRGSWYSGNAAAICIFEMSNGSVFCYRGSWCSEGAPTSWEAEWRICGSSGTAIWNGTANPYCEKVRASEKNVFTNNFDRIEFEPCELKHEGHFGCLDEMFEALIAGRKAETDCSDNIKSMQMVFGALESAKTGKKVMLLD